LDKLPEIKRDGGRGNELDYRVTSAALRSEALASVINALGKENIISFETRGMLREKLGLSMGGRAL